MNMKLLNHIILMSIGLLLISTFGSCRLFFDTQIDAASAYESKQYVLATDLLIEQYNAEKELQKKSDIAYKIAECFRLANRTKESENWYKNALEYSSDSAVTFKYALALKSNGNYKRAMQLFKEYALNNPNDKIKATREIQACRQAMEWQNDLTAHKVINLQSINTNASDFAAVPYTDNQLVFTSSRKDAKGEEIYGWTGEKYSDLFVTTEVNPFVFTPAVQFGDSINTAFNEGIASFTADFEEVYFTACGSESEQDSYCQIYTTQKNETGVWNLPEPVRLFETDTFNIGQPFITPDGKQLYFSADAADSFGDKDLYVVTKMNDGFWSEPQNLGPAINTENYEGYPYIGTDGLLYFASNGHGGMGGLDIYVAEEEGKIWTNPKNLKSPINSHADDFAFVMKPYIAPELIDSIEMIGYFSSSRPNGKGNDDIYMFVLEVPKEVEPIVPIIDTPKVAVNIPPKPPTIRYVLEGKILQTQFEIADNPESKETGKAGISQAIVEIWGVSDNSKITKRLVTNSKGEFSLDIEAEATYQLSASKTGFFRNSSSVSTNGKTPIDNVVKVYTEIVLDKIYKQREIELNDIYFDYDLALIRDDAKPTLNKLAKLLNENPQIKIEMGSHTDSRGSDSYNQTLSQQRAEATVSYLVSLGIDGRRLIAKGYGETRLKNECEDGITCSEEEHQLNRRTTFKVTADNFSAPSLRF